MSIFLYEKKTISPGQVYNLTWWMGGDIIRDYGVGGGYDGLKEAYQEKKLP